MIEPTLFTTEAEPAPPPPPYWASRPFGTGAHPTPRPPVPTAPRRVLLVALICAVLAERASRAAAVGLNWAIVIGAVSVGVAVVRRRPGRAAVGLLAVVALAGMALAWRSTAWLVLPNALIGIVGLCLAATFAARGSFWSSGFGALIGRSIVWLQDVVAVPGWLIASLRAARQASEPGSGTEPSEKPPWGPRLMGAIVAVPIVIVLAALLADADDRFATLADPLWWGSPVWSGVLVTLFAWLALSVLRLASRPVEEPLSTEATVTLSSGNVVLGSMAATFALFAASHLVSLQTLGERTATKRGVTWSGEARSGFFQLLAVAAITLVVVLVSRVLCGVGSVRSRRTQTLLIVGNCLLVLVVVGTAIAQLMAYRAQYGWTMLRLATTATAWWLGLVFLIIATATLLGQRRSRWLTGAVLASALIGLGIANAADPASFVARSNLHRAAVGSPVELDVDYLLTSLGDDALPAVAESFGSLDPEQRRRVRAHVCARRSPTGWWTFRWSRHQADRAAAQICASRPDEPLNE